MQRATLAGFAGDLHLAVAFGAVHVQLHAGDLSPADSAHPIDSGQAKCTEQFAGTWPTSASTSSRHSRSIGVQ